jgi:hypothetical protein
MSWSRVSLFVVLLTGPSVAHAQAPAPSGAVQPANPPGVKESLDTLNTLVRRVPNASLGVNFAEFRVRMVLDKLQRLAAGWPATAPVDYRVNLDRSARALAQALALPAPDQLQALLEALADDLEVKLQHCTNSGGQLGGSVAVTVRTLDGDRDSRNWQVFYIPKVLDVLGGATPDRFPQSSSQALETLVPGLYVMWARDPSSDRTGEKTVVKIGEGRPALDLDLPVPSSPPR